MSYRTLCILDLSDCFLRPVYVLILASSTCRATKLPLCQQLLTTSSLEYSFWLCPSRLIPGTGLHLYLHILPLQIGANLLNPTPDPSPLTQYLTFTGLVKCVRYILYTFHVLSHSILIAAPCRGINTMPILQLRKQRRVK